MRRLMSVDRREKKHGGVGEVNWEWGIAKRVWIENPESGPKTQSKPIWIAVHLIFDRRIAVIFVRGTDQQFER